MSLDKKCRGAQEGSTKASAEAVAVAVVAKATGNILLWFL